MRNLEKYHGVLTKTQTDEKYHVSIFMYNSTE